MKKDVTITYLELNSPDDFIPSKTVRPELRSARMGLPNFEINRFFYSSVGRDWLWVDRLVWSDEQWRAWAERPELETWIGYLNATPIGYFELEHQDNGSIEIAHFGLMHDFTGKGLGGVFLTHAINRAWEAGAERVWLHTCTLDHPAALGNYKARGMSVFKMETKIQEIPD